MYKIVIYLLMSALMGGAPPLLAQTAVWDTLPIRLNKTVRFMYEDTLHDKLYIGGNFWTANGDSCNYFLSYDGQTFETPALDSAGEPILIPQTPVAAASFEGNILVSGKGLARFDQIQWEWMDYYNAVIWDIFPYGDKVIFGGNFSSIAGDSLNSIAVWDGTHWSDLHGFKQVVGTRPAAVLAIAEYQDQLYLAGNFTRADALNEIARWDGQQWIDVGGGMVNGGLGGVNEMVVFQDELYVGGIFTKQGGAPGNNLARWNGYSWDDLGGGVGIKDEGANSVNQLLVFNDELWVTGSFFFAGGIPTSYLARWDGERWYGLGDQSVYGYSVLGTYHDTLYATTYVPNADGSRGAYMILKLLDPAYYDTASAPVVNTSVRGAPAQADLFTLYPNPAQDQLTLEAAQLPPDQFTVTISDAQGRAVWQREVSHPGGDLRQVIDLGEVSEGLYVVRIVGRERQEVQRVWVR